VNTFDTDIAKAIAHDQTELAKELANMAIENQKLMQKQIDMALTNGRASMEMARDLSLKTAEMWQNALFSTKAEA
jgi:hypothetical protein